MMHSKMFTVMHVTFRFFWSYIQLSTSIVFARCDGYVCLWTINNL